MRQRIAHRQYAVELAVQHKLQRLDVSPVKPDLQASLIQVPLRNPEHLGRKIDPLHIVAHFSQHNTVEASATMAVEDRLYVFRKHPPEERLFPLSPVVPVDQQIEALCEACVGVHYSDVGLAGINSAAQDVAAGAYPRAYRKLKF